MPIFIHEYLDGNGNIGSSVETNVSNSDIDLTEATVETNIDPDSLMVDIEAIHAIPHTTRNYTRYTAECLKNSVAGWTKPYPKPLIKHHDEQHGDIIGRVIAAEYKTHDTFSNTPAVLLTVNVPNEQAKADIKNGINRTVSIGIIAHDVRCSVCGRQIELDNAGHNIACEHQRGHIYGKETAYWDVYAMEPKEISYVIVPSDMFAGNVRSYPASKNVHMVTESYDNNIQNTIEEGEINDMDMKEMEAKLQTSEKKVSDLEAGLQAMTESKGALDAKVKEMTEAVETSAKKIEATEKANNELTAKIEILESTKTSLETKISDMTEAAKEQEAKIADEIKMRESLEEELAKVKTELKESLIDNLQAFRKLMGKTELDADKLKNREESSIRDSIEDMKIELKESTNLPKPGSVISPSLTEEAKDNSQVHNMKENAEDSNVDLKAGLENIFMSVARAYR